MSAPAVSVRDAHDALPMHSTWYLLSLTVMWGAFSFHWTALSNNIVPTRVLEFATDATKGSLLGLVTVAGGLASMLTGPIAGVLSDETRSRWGRRRPFLVVGVALNCLALLALVGVTTWAGLLAAVLAVRCFGNVASGPYSALIPDQVGDAQKGRATGFAGFAEVLGRLAGAVVGGLCVAMPAAAAAIGPVLFFAWPSLARSAMMPLVLIVIAVMVGATLFTLWRIPEAPALTPARATVPLLSRAFTFDVRAERSFAWLLLARGFNMLGINTVVTFLLYFIRDYLGVGDIAEANAKLGYLFAASALTTLPSALAVGYLIDRHGRRKLWVYASSIGLAVVCVSFLTVRHYSEAVLLGAAFGLCYGAYFTSDWALALTLLPKNGSAAKYMGLWGVAGTLPEVLAPGIGGVMLDVFNAVEPNLGYRIVFCAVAVYIAVGGVLLYRVVEPSRSAFRTP
jgi:MFS family permease